MKILGIKKNTSTSSILKELISPFIDLFSFIDFTDEKLYLHWKYYAYAISPEKA